MLKFHLIDIFLLNEAPVLHDLGSPHTVPDTYQAVNLQATVILASSLPSCHEVGERDNQEGCDLVNGHPLAIEALEQLDLVAGRTGRALRGVDWGVRLVLSMAKRQQEGREVLTWVEVPLVFGDQHSLEVVEGPVDDGHARILVRVFGFGKAGSPGLRCIFLGHVGVVGVARRTRSVVHRHVVGCGSLHPGGE